MKSFSDLFPLFPAETKQLRQWVVWRFEAPKGDPDGKLTKVPYNPTTGERASSTAPATWSDYQTACEALRQGKCDGIGFVFSKDDPYTGTDLDSCRDYHTEDIEEWAATTIERLDSYAELSPSETGIHILTKAKLPEGGRKKGKVEMYDHARFFTVTGKHLDGTPRTIEERQEAQAALHFDVFGQHKQAEPAATRPAEPLDIDDEALIEKAKHAKGGERFASLWDGDTAAYDGDESRADQALCNRLAFWTQGDKQRIDSLFRRSKLYRDKWDEGRGDKGTYGEITIAKALAGATAFYDPSRNGRNGVLAVEAVEAAQTPAPAVIHTETTPARNPSQAPELPPYARLSAEQIKEASCAGRWLDEYVNFAAEASPLTPHGFHLAGGLFAGALAIARRVNLLVSTSTNTIYPNLYTLFVGPSTKPRKTTAFRVLQGLIHEAEMDHFLLAERQTPEALSSDLTLKVPGNYDAWAEDDQTQWLKERAIVAQRGWLLDEASHLLDSFNRDYTSGLLPLVLDLYNSSEIGPKRNTVSRGREGIRAPYLNIFGATTYAALGEHFKNAGHWHNGLFARFALVNADNSGEWEFWPKPMLYPRQLVERLHYVAYGLLPTPAAWLQVNEDNKTKTVMLSQPLQSYPVSLARGGVAWEQWERYSKATSFDLIDEGRADVPSKFHASYGRMGTMLIKVAMILATLDAEELPVVVEPRHVYRAQLIVESWRETLHVLLEKAADAEPSDVDQTETNIMYAVERIGWATAREIRLHVHQLKNLPTDETEKRADSLVRAGMLVKQRMGRTDRYALVSAVSATPAPAVSVENVDM